MHALGRLEDLPQDYRDELTRLNLVPLWPNLRALLPPQVPSRNTKPTHWPYATLKPLLMRAGELTPMEKAERRVLVLANPGHGLENMKASPAMYLGMQLLLPKEWAPAHRHTPNAVRMIVEGRGATTTVNGEKCPMERGDLILTPTGQWHEHEHSGDEPVVWLDVLDLPLMYYAEVSYAVEGQRQEEKAGRGDEVYARGGVVPTPYFERGREDYPMLRYPWKDTRAALLALAQSQPDRAFAFAGVPCSGRPSRCHGEPTPLHPGRGRHLLHAGLRGRDAGQPVDHRTRLPLHRRRIAPAPQVGRVRSEELISRSRAIGI